MEKKLAFKLKFIKNQLNKNFQSVPSTKNKKKHQKKNTIEEEKQQQDSIPPNESESHELIIQKFIDPIQCHRICGDMIFLDHIPEDQKFVGLSNIRTYFKKIGDIKISKNFILASYEELELPHSNISLLVDRLKSLGDSTKYDMAKQIEQLGEKFNSINLTKKKVENIQVSDSYDEFNKILNLHQNEPILTYHYTKCAKLGMVLSKYGMNKIMKYLTFRDDIRIFEQSIIVIPSEEYWIHTTKLLQNLFVRNDQFLKMHLNTIVGVRNVLAKDYSFTFYNNGALEKIIVLAFPKNIQTTEIQELYDTINLEICQLNDITKDKKSKDFNSWEKLLKIYFKKWLKEEYRHGENYRCGYKIIKNEENY